MGQGVWVRCVMNGEGLFTDEDKKESRKPPEAKSFQASADVQRLEMAEP